MHGAFAGRSCSVGPEPVPPRPLRRPGHARGATPHPAPHPRLRRRALPPPAPRRRWRGRGRRSRRRGGGARGEAAAHAGRDPAARRGAPARVATPRRGGGHQPPHREPGARPQRTQAAAAVVGGEAGGYGVRPVVQLPHRSRR